MRDRSPPKPAPKPLPRLESKPIEHASRPGRKCDCLNACGDDPALKNGRADPCERYIKAEQEAAERALWRTCKWQDASKTLPDAEETVLIALIEATEPVWFGYYDGARWRDDFGLQVKVSHWAPLPYAPGEQPC